MVRTESNPMPEADAILSSTSMGSMALAPRYGFAPTPEYKITKTAMNMLNVQWALALEKEGFTVLAISPGVSDDPKISSPCSFRLPQHCMTDS